ncbi:MAG: hypothetical protein UT19_C0014G0018 [Candidatus Woesebacteria bacterium GW2011_GWB1_39_10b]|uniref:Uncharacterized protein n=1 Tax=Candidatus Woesebacteria bacterium GW2011_GWB1_39_10b TaxID=1618573 RepID=A0A0G0P5A6_9BACT|nr:MAG: hypothetical protein US72_C0025G0003 [Microgenomates group bacterium GW2011_GWC1_38_12]KKQ93314.1 MAG: hypothetical protein UT19_C0014G0018 [Candidatus Woesebacteria bacterium GW2011_GWB1_39_10b]
MMNFYLQIGHLAHYAFSPEGEEAIYYGRCSQKKGRVRRQANCQVQERGFGLRSSPGGKGPSSLQAAF